MPVQWTISTPHRLVIAVARDELRLKDVTTYLDGLAIADVLSYRKIFDMTHATFDDTLHAKRLLTSGELVTLIVEVIASPQSR